ncbi:transcriptional regulator [Halovivax ruber XH-70]|uniref:Transcriptional regulator n=1 Tax=Halovivax ruber (strain DSM 18193 / JCM 13892 / XH-70) TaxID=797302 RepID=L0IC97_HALRX|nr:TetR/AcrR family transcriptional regulator [Halovivax ruber]AGB16448.1 transcriptional regulator [Halovivax ruber XH-70]
MGDTRVEILEAAVDILIESGYDALTTEAIADRLEISHSGVHYHFETKDDLLIALIEEYLTDQLEAKVAFDGPPEKQLPKLLEFRIRGAKTIQQLEIPPPSIQLLAATGGSDDALRQALDTLFEAYVAELTATIRDGVESGVFDTEAPERTAWTLAGLIEGAEVRASHDGSPAPFVWGIEAYVLPALYVDESPTLNVEVDDG